MEDFESDFDAAAAIESIIRSDPAPAVETPAVESPQAPEIQPQAAPEAERPNDGVNASEEASAPAVIDTAPAVSEAPKPQPVSSPELDQRLSEANRTQQEAAAARDQFITQTSAIVQHLEAVAAGKFSDLKTPQDVLSLMQTDPGRYNEFVVWQTQIGQARQARDQASQAAHREYISSETARLHKAIPELGNPETGPAMAAKLRAYAKSQGIPDNRQARSADEVISLHREMVLAEKVQAFESEKTAQAAKLAEANKKAAKAPPVQQPGTQRDTNKDEKASTDFSRFQKSGRLDDLATALSHIL